MNLSTNEQAKIKKTTQCYRSGFVKNLPNRSILVMVWSFKRHCVMNGTHYLLDACFILGWYHANVDVLAT